MTDTGALDNPLASLAKGVWWLLLLRGILAVIFGIVALIAPGAALTAVAIVVGAYAVVDGIAAIVHSFQLRATNPRWGWLLASGILTVLAGLAALILPGVAALFVLWTIVFWTIMTGALGLRSAAGAAAGRAKTWGILAGVVSLVFGVILAISLFIAPGSTVIGLIWTVGIWAIVFGVMLVGAAISTRAGVKTAA